jgi:hypothetical protein
MKKMFLFFSHTLTASQADDAKKSLGITSFVMLPDNLQNLWSNIPSDLESLDSYLIPLKNYISKNSKKGDIVLLQGDVGAVYDMVKYIQNIGLKVVYATTKREVNEKTVKNKVIKISVFKHIRYREYR